MDLDAFHDGLVASLGDSIREGKSVLLGHPLTGEVAVSLSKSDFPGLVYIHEALGSAGTDENNPESEEGGSFSTALLLPNVIAPSLLIYNAPVLVAKKDDGLWHVIDLDGVKATEFFYGLKDRLQRSVGLDQVDYGLIRPTSPPSMKVIVSRAKYNIDDIIYSVGAVITVDLSSYVPGSGQAKAIRIDTDPTTRTLSIRDDDDRFDDTLTHEQAFTDHYPVDVTAGLFVNGWIRMYGGMVAIDIPDILVGQEIYTKGSAGGGGTTRSMARRHMSGGQVIASSVPEAVNFNENDWDDEGYFAFGGDEIHTPSDNVYEIQFTLMFDTSTPTVWLVKITVNGSPLNHSQDLFEVDTNYNSFVNYTTKLYLSSTPTLQLEVTQSSGGDLNIEEGSWITVHKIPN